MTGPAAPVPTPDGLASERLATAMAAALAEAAEVALVAVRLTGRLARMEDEALRIVEETAAAAQLGLVDPPNLEAAIQAGRDADACEAARVAAVPRIAAIDDCVEKAVRTLRRTVALQRRFANPRPFPGPNSSPNRPAPRPRPERDADPAEATDRPELGHEFGIETDGQLFHALGRDVVRLTAAIDRLTGGETGSEAGRDTPTPPGHTPPGHTPPSQTPPGQTPRFTPPASGLLPDNGPKPSPATSPAPSPAPATEPPSATAPRDPPDG